MLYLPLCVFLGAHVLLPPPLLLLLVLLLVVLRYACVYSIDLFGVVLEFNKHSTCFLRRAFIHLFPSNVCSAALARLRH